MLARRTLLLGLLAAPAIIRTPGLVMAVRPWRSTPFAIEWVDRREYDYGCSIQMVGQLAMPDGRIIRHSAIVSNRCNDPESQASAEAAARSVVAGWLRAVEASLA